MTSVYKIKAFGSTLTLKYNNSFSGAAAHDVYICAESNVRDDVVYASIRGEKNIREFLYNFAVIGGIIKEGETLEIAEPSDKEVPADGIYRLVGAHESRTVAIVQGGRVLVPQPEDEQIEDFTDTYLSKYSKWELTPLVKTERRNLNYA